MSPKTYKIEEPIGESARSDIVMQRRVGINSMWKRRNLGCVEDYILAIR